MRRSESRSRTNKRGISIILVVIVAVIIISIAGIGTYFAVGIGSNSRNQSNQTTSDTSLVAGSQSQTSTRVVSTARSTSVSSTLTGISTYSGTFNFSLPLGPSGDRAASNNSIETYNSIQVGHGTFTFFVSAANKSGSGSGSGTFTITTAGFCGGSVSFHYTFQIPDATSILGNLTVFIGTPTPSTYMVPLSCAGSLTGVDTTTNNPGPFLAIYPNELSVASLPATVNEHLSGGINYSYTIIQTS
jgi:hypothetical protein